MVKLSGGGYLLRMDSHRPIRAPRTLILAALLAGSSLALLGGCGIRGDLVPAPPIAGEARREWEAREAQRKRAEEEARQQQQATQPAASAPSGAPKSN